jgi:hypothetical protein
MSDSTVGSVRKPWTPEEHALLAELCKGPIPIIRQLHLFPGRTETAIYQHMYKTGLSMEIKNEPHRPDDVVKLLANGPMFAFEIAEALGVTVQAIRPVISKLHSDHEVYIAERVRLSQTARNLKWALGDKPDAPQAAFEPLPPKAKSVRKLPLSVVKVRRDPLQEALFGRVKALIVATEIHGRVYKADMEVTEDELEIAA